MVKKNKKKTQKYRCIKIEIYFYSYRQKSMSKCIHIQTLGGYKIKSGFALQTKRLTSYQLRKY